MTAALRVSVDVTAVPDRPAGAGRYVIELVRGLDRRDEVELVLIARAEDSGRWAQLAPRAEVAALAPSRRPVRLLWEQLRLPSLLDRLGVDVHHAPHYTMPERARVPVVVTVHDLTLFDNPEWHERSKVLVFRRAIAVATRRADALVCVSADTAGRLAQRFGDLPEVRVVPHGVDHARFRPGGADDAANDAAQLDALGVVGPYVVFVGTLEPRKNVHELVAAFDGVASGHPALSLVLAGRRGWGTTALDAALDASPHRDRVHVLGFVDDASVPSLLRRAAVVAYPSLAEGFGLPALEALACGAPLVTTTGSAIEELVGDAAVLVPPGDVTALTEALRSVLDDPSGATALRAAGPARAARYTWDATIDAHIALYREAASRRVRG